MPRLSASRERPTLSWGLERSSLFGKILPPPGKKFLEGLHKMSTKQIIWTAILTTAIGSIFSVITWSFKNNFHIIVKNQDRHEEKLDKQFEKISDLSDRVATLEGVLKK
jgi:hypothetical protein